MDQRDTGLQKRLAEFVRYRREYLRGDEKGEAQIFGDALFRAFGHAGVRQAGATLEQRIKKMDAKGTAFADLMLECPEDSGQLLDWLTHAACCRFRYSV